MHYSTGHPRHAAVMASLQGRGAGVADHESRCGFGGVSPGRRLSLPVRLRRSTRMPPTAIDQRRTGFGRPGCGGRRHHALGAVAADQSEQRGPEGCDRPLAGGAPRGCRVAVIPSGRRCPIASALWRCGSRQGRPPLRIPRARGKVPVAPKLRTGEHSQVGPDWRHPLSTRRSNVDQVGTYPFGLSTYFVAAPESNSA